MFLHIDDNMTVEEVQDRFRECFPFLKIAFYSAAHKRFESSDKQYQYAPDARIEEIRKNHFCGVMEIKSWHTVAKVEKQLQEVFGLHAQVFRCNANGQCTQTSLSDNLTLQEQSELGYDLDKAW